MKNCTLYTVQLPVSCVHLRNLLEISGERQTMSEIQTGFKLVWQTRNQENIQFTENSIICGNLIPLTMGTPSLTSPWSVVYYQLSTTPSPTFRSLLSPSLHDGRQTAWNNIRALYSALVWSTRLVSHKSTQKHSQQFIVRTITTDKQKLGYLALPRTIWLN